MVSPLLVADLDGKQLDSQMGNSAAITVAIIPNAVYSFVPTVSQQQILCANRSIVVAVVFDNYTPGSTDPISFHANLGSAATVASAPDWVQDITVTMSASSTAPVIFGFGTNQLPGSPIPVYPSTTFDFSICFKAPINSTGATCRVYLIGVVY